ncbi:MAG: LacI family transcriptional regulator [Cryptosporangiaceae bacterium]|nr:LacI family transcriptional regulator [Cryptosporangiaceae bacterium]
MPSARRVTLAEVAARAGVSRAAASFVLTGRQDMRISETSQQRVLAAAAALGYRPNLTARSLRTSVTRTFGLISDTIAVSPFAGQIVQGAVAAARESGHLLFVAETGGDPAAEEAAVREMVDRQADGLLYAAMFTRPAAVPSSGAGQPTVLVNCLADGAACMIPDELEAGRAAARILLLAGHRDGIYLAGTPEPTVFAAREREEGIEAELAAAGTALAGTLHCDWWPGHSFEAVRAFLDGGGRPSALICLNDRIALGAYQALAEAGLRIPADVSVVSFDDSDLASWLRPGLTSIALPHYDLGYRATTLLAAGQLDAGVHRIAMPVRARESVRG